MKKIKFEDLPSENTPINSANLDTLQDNIEESAVIVSSTEPQTNEKVWFQKSKNLINKEALATMAINSDGSLYYAGDNYFTTDFIKINPNSSYSKTDTGSPRVKLFDKNKKVISTNSYDDISNFNYGGTYKIPFSNAEYIRFTINSNDISNAKIQFEEGEKQTNYEPYTPNKIYTKTNGVFEEFYNEEEAIPKTITNEKGTAIKFADGTLIQYGVRKDVNLQIKNSTNGGFFDTGWFMKFAIPFMDNNYCGNATIIGKEAKTVNIYSIDNLDKEQMLLNLFSPVQYSGNVGFRWFAIGRWK